VIGLPSLHAMDRAQERGSGWPVKLRTCAADLIDCSGDIGEQAPRKNFRASLNLTVEPGLYMLVRFQKPAVRDNRETGNQAF